MQKSLNSEYKVIANTQQLKIAIVADKFPVRSETFIRAHAVDLANRGFSVSVISCGAGDGIVAQELEEIDGTGVERITVPCFGSHRIDNLTRLLRVVVRYPRMAQYLLPSSFWTRREMFLAHEISSEIERVQPDVVHVHLGSVAAPLAHYGLCRPTVVTWHGYDANCVPSIRGEGLYEALFSNADVVHTVGSNFMQQRLHQLGASSCNVEKIPMGIDTSYFTYKKRAALENNPLRIISVGRLDEMKGHAFLIQAVSEMIKEGHSIELRIVGDGPLRHALLAQIKETQHSSHITLLGAKTKREVLAELHRASLFCLTGTVADSGRVESQGVVFAEAQATGLPVIGSAVGGVPDSIIDTETGLLCSPSDIASIKQAILFFLENTHAINAFGERGRAFVESEFMLNRMTDSFDRLYRSLLTTETVRAYRTQTSCLAV